MGRWNKSADAYNEIFPMWLKKFAEGDGFEAGIRYKGKLVGMVGIHPVSWGKKATSLGYYLAEDAGGERCYDAKCEGCASLCI